MKYICKETGETKTYEEIKEELSNLLQSGYEFEEYRDDIDKFISDYFIIIENKQEIIKDLKKLSHEIKNCGHIYLHKHTKHGSYYVKCNDNIGFFVNYEPNNHDDEKYIIEYNNIIDEYIFYSYKNYEIVGEKE